MKDRAHEIVGTVRQTLVRLPRAAKSGIAFTVDLVGLAVCVVAALWLVMLGPYTESASLIIIVTAIASVLFAGWQGMYRSVVRYMGLDLFVAGARTALGSAVVGAGLMKLFVFGATPYRWAAAYAAFSFIYICGSRYAARMFLIERRAPKHRERVIIYGAGSAGVKLVSSLSGGDEYLPTAMLDDDPKLQGTLVKGLEVYPPSKLESLCRHYGVNRLLLAVPRAKLSIRRRILESLSEFPLHVQTIPEFSDIVSGRARVDDIRDVEVEDLLGRDPVPPQPQLLKACVSGKNVLVTGAGGSIGSELCRQLLALNPKRLILFDIGELALYHVERQLLDMQQELKNDCEIVPLLGSVEHATRIREVIQTFEVQTLYHAAAYKHVPLVEQNFFEGIKNNVLGTLQTARAAVDGKVETFVLISTDKAVNPTSIMGATKRLAELILQAENSQSKSTRFCMVRFGNVLESSGSVVPLFREQIRNGGPITVTHRDIIRYFMTIPEAAELVIQAGSMARGGDVFVLDMGEPVRIRDLAYRMVNLMGFTILNEANPDGDIAIEYTGLRPAEKLYEELLIGSNASGTRHPRILRADEEFLPADELSAVIDGLIDSLNTLDYGKARKILAQAVVEYSPADDISDLAWLRRNADDKSAGVETVVAFPRA